MSTAVAAAVYVAAPAAVMAAAAAAAMTISVAAAAAAALAVVVGRDSAIMAAIAGGRCTPGDGRGDSAANDAMDDLDAADSDGGDDINCNCDDHGDGDGDGDDDDDGDGGDDDGGAAVASFRVRLKVKVVCRGPLALVDGAAPQGSPPPATMPALAVSSILAGVPISRRTDFRFTSPPAATSKWLGGGVLYPAAFNACRCSAYSGL